MGYWAVAQFDDARPVSPPLATDGGRCATTEAARLVTMNAALIPESSDRGAARPLADYTGRIPYQEGTLT